MELYRQVGLALALGASLGGCRRATPAPAPTPDPGQVVAVFDGGQFTRGEIEPALKRHLQARPDQDRQQALRALIERRVRVALLKRDALAAGMAEKPDVKEMLAAIEAHALAEDWLATNVAARAAARPEQVEEATREAARASQGRELRSFSHIFLRAAAGDADARAGARATMATIRQALDEGESFDDLARRYSDSITSRSGGHVDWTPKEPLQDQLAELVFGLREGQISEPLETRTGLHLFRLDGIRRPQAVDEGAVRGQVRARLDGEAARAAVEAERARVVDTSGVRLDPAFLERRGQPDEVLAAAGGRSLTRQGLAWLRGWPPDAHRPAPELVRRWLADQLLAARRRAQPIDAALQRRLDDARGARIVELRREELMAQIATDSTPEEERAFYEKYRDTAPVLREHRIDLLFLAQQGDSPGEVYARGEAVSKRLRGGEDFGAIVASLAKQPGTVARRGLETGDLDGLRGQSGRLAQTLGALRPGDVSAPTYLDGDVLRFAGREPLVRGRGLAFVRLQGTAALPLAAVRGRLRELVRDEKRRAGIVEIQRRLNERGKLQILVTDL